MLFGEKLRPLSDFLPRVLSHIDGIDVDMVATYTMDSIIQFIRDTKLLTEVICIDLKDCVHSYKLNTTRRIMEVISVRFVVNGQQRPSYQFKYRIEGDVFYLDNLPSCALDARVEIELAVNLPRDCDEVPDVIYEEWVDAVTALTLTKLYLLTDNDWYNPQAAGNQQGLYQQLVKQARFSTVTKHRPLVMRLVNKRRL